MEITQGVAYKREFVMRGNRAEFVAMARDMFSQKGIPEDAQVEIGTDLGAALTLGQSFWVRFGWETAE